MYYDNRTHFLHTSIMNINVCFIALLIVAANEIKGDNEGRCKRQTTSTCFLMPQAEQGPYY
jgi:hypothetical protein